MQLNSCFRFPQDSDSLSFKIIQGKWKERYCYSTSKSCLQNIKAVAVRIFISIALILAAAADLCVWSLRTITIIPAVNRGPEHFCHLISIATLPFLAFAILFGHNPKIDASKPIPEEADQLPDIVPDVLPVIDPQPAPVSEDLLSSEQSDEIIEREVLAWAEEFRKQGKEIPKEIPCLDMTLRRDFVSRFNDLIDIYMPRRRNLSQLRLLKTVILKLLIAKQDPNESLFYNLMQGHLKSAGRPKSVWGFMRDLDRGHPARSWRFAMIKSLLRRRDYDHFSVIKINVNQLNTFEQSRNQPRITLVSQLFVHPDVYDYVYNSMDEDDLNHMKQGFAIAIELIRNGATVNLDFEQYQKDIDQVIQDFSQLWPRDMLIDALWIPNDMKVKIEKALEPYVKDTNFYMSILKERILWIIDNSEGYTICSGQRLNIDITLREAKKFVTHLIAFRSNFEQAQQEWLAKKESWLAQIAVCGLPRPLIGIVAGYSDLLEYTSVI